MSTIPSNLYAEKVFSEHPIGLWSLDDAADYVSLAPNNDFLSWDISGATISVVSLKDVPFPESDTYRLVVPEFDQNIKTITCISPQIANFSELNYDLNTFAISSYIYSESPYITSIEIGYEYFDSLQGETVQKLKKFSSNIFDKWVFVSETFDIPLPDVDFSAVLKINYFSDTEANFDSQDYIFNINGFSIGQWSEEFNSVSLGQQPITIPSNIAVVGGLNGIEAREYGFSENPGYYLLKNNALVAKNSGVPLVYGATSNTTLFSNDNLPSLIIPGNGFLNDAGKYGSYTLEFWMRLESNSIQSKKIVGPVSSTDGLYVDKSFLRLSVGKYSGAYYVGEWYTPMLIDIRYSSESVSMLVNGVQAISFTIDPNEITFPEKYQGSTDQDWIGFYAYDDIYPIELDCIGIYPYQVSNVLAKRRWVYGQAVEFPENINTAYSGTSFFIDYPFAKYANNYNYPDIAKWSNGVLENVDIVGNTLSVKNQEYPEIIFQSKDIGSWENILFNMQNELEPYIRLKMDESGWESENPYIYLRSSNFSNAAIKAFYGIFKTLNSNDHPLIILENENTQDKFIIEIKNSKLQYSLLTSSGSEVVYEKNAPPAGEFFVAGLNIDNIADEFGGNLALFFGNFNQCKIYVGGGPNIDSFDGNIYNFSLLTNRNFSKISGLFGSTGIAGDYQELESFLESIGPETLLSDIIDAGLLQETKWSFIQNIYDGGNLSDYFASEFLNHIATYSFKLNKTESSFILDVAAEAYWEDYVPLSYFAKYVTDSRGNNIYSLDFIQFNIDYPAPSIFLEEETESTWTYEELQAKYTNPISRTYSDLDNSLFTGFENYIDLAYNSVKQYKYDTSESMVKTYITFQYLASGSNAPYEKFTNIELTPKNGVINVGANGENWLNTKYEVVDNVVIYPPQDVPFEDLAIVVHIEITSYGINKYPIKIKSLQMTSQSLNSGGPTPIGTRFGNQIFPYKKNGIYFDYKTYNPFTIYKGSTPYLYLTKKSGIQVRGNFNQLESRGISMPINQSLANNYKVIAMQAAIRFDQDFFPYDPIEIFEVQSKNSYIKFYLKSTHPQGKRAKIYAVDTKTGKLENGIAFYLNGNIVKDPTLTVKEWAILGINFANTLDFSNYAGAIRITGPITFNMISHYQSTNLQEVQQVSTRPWFKVKALDVSTELDWFYWDSDFIWNGVLVISSTSYYGVNPSDIYKMYTGTNKIIIDDAYTLMFKDYQYSAYTDLVWQSQSISAV